MRMDSCCSKKKKIVAEAAAAAAAACSSSSSSPSVVVIGIDWVCSCFFILDFGSQVSRLLLLINFGGLLDWNLFLLDIWTDGRTDQAKQINLFSLSLSLSSFLDLLLAACGPSSMHAFNQNKNERECQSRIYLYIHIWIDV